MRNGQLRPYAGTHVTFPRQCGIQHFPACQVCTVTADEFAKLFGQAMSALQVGPGSDEASDVGPLINAETRDKVAGLVEETAAGAAIVTTGGGAPEGRGYFFNPTVLSNVEPGSSILRTEIFGPVAPMRKPVTRSSCSSGSPPLKIAPTSNSERSEKPRD